MSRYAGSIFAPPRPSRTPPRVDELQPRRPRRPAHPFRQLAIFVCPTLLLSGVVFFRAADPDPIGLAAQARIARPRVRQERFFLDEARGLSATVSVVWTRRLLDPASEGESAQVGDRDCRAVSVQTTIEAGGEVVDRSSKLTLLRLPEENESALRIQRSVGDLATDVVVVVRPGERGWLDLSESTSLRIEAELAPTAKSPASASIPGP